MTRTASTSKSKSRMQRIDRPRRIMFSICRIVPLPLPLIFAILLHCRVGFIPVQGWVPIHRPRSRSRSTSVASGTATGTRAPDCTGTTILRSSSSPHVRLRLHTIAMWASPDDSSDDKESDTSISSRNRAISALSQPGTPEGTSEPAGETETTAESRNLSESSSSSILPRSSPPSGRTTSSIRRSRKMKSSSRKSKGGSNNSSASESSNTNTAEALAPAAPTDGSRTFPKNQTRNQPNSRQRQTSSSSSSSSGNPKSSYSSLLPPPLTGETPNGGDDDEDDPLSTGLSSWEEFLGASSTASSSVSSPPLPSLENTRFAPNQRRQGRRTTSPKPATNSTVSQQRLPSIQDLFPPDLSSTTSTSTTGTTTTTTTTGRQNPQQQPKPESKRGRRSQPVLDGVLPVSDLFYRSSQQQDPQEDQQDEGEHDDEELPFSAEQSDAVYSDNNKVHIRRNMAQQQQQVQQQQQQQQEESSTEAANASSSSSSSTTKNTSGRKMVRRGMEMLVGGVPINADPPQRAVELYYDHAAPDWGSTITLSTRDFGPLLHTASTAQVSKKEKGLFCEHFCHSAMKWDVCPKDLRQIVKSYTMQQLGVTTTSSGNRPVRLEDVAKENVLSTETNEGSADGDMTNGKSDSDSSGIDDPREKSDLSLSYDDEEEEDKLETTNAYGESAVDDETEESSLDTGQKARSKAKGFGKGKDAKQPKRNRKQNEPVEDWELALNIGVSLEIGVSKAELESGNGGADGSIFKSFFISAFASALKRELSGFHVTDLKLNLIDLDDGTTLIDALFTLQAVSDLSHSELTRRMKDIDAAFKRTIDDGELQVAMAAAAKEDTQWPEEVRARVVEELLFGEDEEDDSGPAIETARSAYQDSCEVALNGAGPLHLRDDIFHGGGRDGVFYDYSENNALGSPYKGEIGLRLVDAVTERAKQRSPRVIAIGDVHGCIDELQDLLRECAYQPGDLVVFLGDLVCKGPDSVSVVQMAREIGALGVRGNHDFEVIRWHQAIKSGVDPPVVGSEHFHIASCLSKADMNWMYSLPWYISSKELGALFVHAGFVSGIRLAKQNPRLMMNMRSILPDGTVTSKFFNNWPWARLWDGPQTVLFGHDADRGLQQYEHAIGLDTGCVYGGRLTACILPEKRLVSVSARREYFKYRRKRYD